MDFTQLPSILTPDLGLLFWMLLAFLVVFGVLAKFGFPAIINMVDERNRYIDESLRKAHEAEERLANIQQEGESILQEAREKQAQILKEAAESRRHALRALACWMRQRPLSNRRRRPPLLTSASRLPPLVLILPKRCFVRTSVTISRRWI